MAPKRKLIIGFDSAELELPQSCNDGTPSNQHNAGERNTYPRFPDRGAMESSLYTGVMPAAHGN